VAERGAANFPQETGPGRSNDDVTVGEGLVLRYSCNLSTLPPTLASRFAALSAITSNILQHASHLLT